MANYCAANAFLDAFSRHRLSQNLPCTSLALSVISDAGYLHQHSELAEKLVRTGVYPLSESEMLKLVDMTLTTCPEHVADLTGEGDYDSPAVGHILTGLELTGVRKLREKGFDGSALWAQDPRAAILATDLERQEEGAGASSKSRANGGPKERIVAALKAGDEVLARKVARETLGKRIASMLLLEEEEGVGEDTPLVRFGLDSMLAAEVRGWVWEVANVDVSFIVLVGEGTTLSGLAEMVVEGVTKGLKL